MPKPGLHRASSMPIGLGREKPSHASASNSNLPAIAQSTANAPSNSTSPVPSARKNPFRKSIMGDVFGTKSTPELSMLGLMYRSRVEERKAKVQDNVARNYNELDEMQGTSQNTLGSQESVGSDNENNADDLEQLNPRQQLAVTIRNWTANAENDSFLIKEGAVHALIALAGFDDSLIKNCCATALYRLSSRPENRADMLSLSATTGVISLSMQTKHWHIAKLCSMALYNLSLEADGEVTMAKDGAILALVILFGMRGQKLLPICVQALYNLTCAKNYFKGMERITKALLNLPSTNFDHSPFLIKALVNTSQYSWLRMRIIEDGALASIAAMIPTISTRFNMNEIVYYIVACLKLLSDSSGCRLEMLAKGTMDILQQLQPHCSETNTYLLVRTLYNLISGTMLGLSTFEMAVGIITSISFSEIDDVTAQFVSSCLNIFANENMRGSVKLTARVMDVVPAYLKSTDSVTLSFTLGTTSCLFFGNLCNDSAKLEQLVMSFVEAGPSITDPSAIESLVICFARLCQEQTFLKILTKLRLLEPLLDLLLNISDSGKDNSVVKECCCVSICIIALNIDAALTAESSSRIAITVLELLQSDNLFALTNAVGTIRALGNKGLCYKEMLSPTLLARVASTISQYSDDASFCRTCCSVLAVFSSDTNAIDGYLSNGVLEVLFAMTRSEDSVTKELVATTLCNLSNDERARDQMVSKGVVDVISTLSGATNELIQELCAKCICNLSCSVELHEKIVKHKVLQPILMIALVRSVAHSTKSLCARALLNLVTDDNLAALKESGAIRIFSTLSTIANPQIQNICARGFLLFTTTLPRREELIQRRAVLQALFGMVKSIQSRTRIVVGMAVCNLLACPVSQRAAISAGALSVLKIISTMSYSDVKEATARVIVNLAQTNSLHPYLLKEPLVPMLIMIVQQSEGDAFEFAVSALAVMSQSELFRVPLIDKGCVSTLVTAVVTGRLLSEATSVEVLRTLCFLSYCRERAEACVVTGQIILALHAVYRSRYCNALTAQIICVILRNLSYEPSIRRNLVNHGAFGILLSIMKDHSQVRAQSYHSIVVTVHNLSLETALHVDLMTHGYMDLMLLLLNTSHCDKDAVIPGIASPSVKQIRKTAKLRRSISINSAALSPLKDTILPEVPLIDLSAKAFLTAEDVICATKSIHHLSTSRKCHHGMVEGDIMSICKGFYIGMTETSRFEIASAISNLSSTKECRATLVSQGVSDFLIQLSSTSDNKTQFKCSLALGYLSELTTVNHGLVSSMLMISLKAEDGDVVDLASQSGGVKKELNTGYEQATITGTDEPGSEGPGSRSLSVMIREGLRSSKSNHRSSASGNDSDVESIDSDVESYRADFTLDKGRLAEEVKSLVGDYSHYEFETIAFSVAPESGGMANQLQADIPVPSLNIERSNASSSSKHEGLAKQTSNAIELPLPKDANKAFEESLRNVHTASSATQASSTHASMFVGSSGSGDAGLAGNRDGDAGLGSHSGSADADYFADGSAEDTIPRERSLRHAKSMPSRPKKLGSLVVKPTAASVLVKTQQGRLSPSEARRRSCL